MPADSQTDHSVYTQVQSVHMAAKCVYSSCCRVLCYNQCVYITMTEHDGVEYTHPACCLAPSYEVYTPNVDVYTTRRRCVYIRPLQQSGCCCIHHLARCIHIVVGCIHIVVGCIHHLAKHAVCEVLCVRFRRFQWFQRCPATHGHAPPTHWLPPTRSGSTHALLPRPRRCRSAP